MTAKGGSANRHSKNIYLALIQQVVQFVHLLARVGRFFNDDDEGNCLHERMPELYLLLA